MPSLSTTGLLQFAPNGFDYSRSLSNSMPGTNGLETFLMDPIFNGFSGDMMCMNIHIQTGSDVWRLQPSTNVNSIMPMVWMNNLDPYKPAGLPAGEPILSCNAVGVAVSFKWYPADGNGTVATVSPIFRALTPLFPGTFVEVSVLVDPFGTYTVQSNTPVAAGGMQPMMMGISSWYVGSQYFTTYTLNSESGSASFDIPFTMGQLTGPNPGSRQYIYNINYNVPLGPSDGNVPNPVDPEQPGNALSIGLTKGIEGNNMTQLGGTIYPYVYYDVTMKNAVWNYTPPLPVNP